MSYENPNTCVADPGQLMEFRCNRCWNSNYATCDQEGKQVRCKYCDNRVTVPEATPERVERAIEAGVSVRSRSTSRPIEKISYTDIPKSRKELRRLEKQYLKQQYVGADFACYPNAPRISRLLAVIIDTIIAVAVALGTGALSWYADDQGLINLQDLVQFDPAKFEDSKYYYEYGIVLFLPICYFLLHCTLLTLLGQSIGKIVMGIRIVKTNGSLPGFFRAVVLRNLVVPLLSAVVPFLSLIDCLFIFSVSSRCLHDYVAGTRVVE